MELTVERLKEVLDYNPKTGDFHYKIARANKKPGDTAGNVGPNGYRTIMIDYRAYYAHHLAILFMTGAPPPKGSHTDHKNRVKHENWWENIRVTTPSVNGHNRKIGTNNASGATGVFRRKGRSRFTARVTIQYKCKTVGTFDTVGEAVAARESYLAANALR